MNKHIRYNMFVVIPITFIIFTLLFSCDRHNPAFSKSGYHDPAAQNIDGDQLSQAIDKLAKIPGMKSIVLGRNGVIAAEEYYNDSGEYVLHDVRSVTKSVMGLLIGIAIREGYIQSVEQSIGEFLVGTVIDTLEKAKSEITIEHLLTMSCGLEWHELDRGDSYSQWFRSGDHVNWVLDQPFIHEPGKGFNYNTGSTHLLSVILTLTTGKSALDFARTYLFEPMGIEQSDWTILSQKKVYNNGGAGLSISPHAMFAIGNLVLNGGVWNKAQLVPAEWITKCISVQKATNISYPHSQHYGYLWWIGQAHERKYFYAMGWGGQFIVCVPDLNFVVVATCEWKGVSDNAACQHWYDILVIIMEDILPAIKE